MSLWIKSLAQVRAGCERGEGGRRGHPPAAARGGARFGTPARLVRARRAGQKSSNPSIHPLELDPL